MGWQELALNVDKVSIMPVTFCKVRWARGSLFSHSPVPSLFIRAGQFLCVVLTRQLMAWHSCLLHLDALFSSTLQVILNFSSTKRIALASCSHSCLLGFSWEWAPCITACGCAVAKVQSDKLCAPCGSHSWKWIKHNGFSPWISSPVCCLCSS